MKKNMGNVVALAGGVGGGKMVYGLAQIVPPEQLTVIVNTGDDFEHLGLYICPDLDTVMYTLAGLANPATGWGVKDESWNMMNAMARYSGPTWFQVGDRDMATHLLRSQWLREGYPLNWIIRELSRRLGINCDLLPMCETPVRTIVQTDEGEMAMQHYFVQAQWQPKVTGLRFDGADKAQISREVISAIRVADVIVFCPSNPLLSLEPILVLPSMRRIIAGSRAKKIAVSPIVGGEAVKGPAAKMMEELGMEVSPVGIATHLQDLLTGFVLDQVDAAYEATLIEMGLSTLVTQTVMHSSEDRVTLARKILEFAVNEIAPQPNS